MRIPVRGLALVSVVLTTAAADAGPSSRRIHLPSDADLHTLLAERVEALAAGEDAIGMVVGVTGPHGRRVVAYGRRGKGDPRPLDGDTAFEIGSVTKVFTALLLADMVRKREVALDDEVVKHLPAAKVPRRNGRAITLLDLATHTSGLPFMPGKVPAPDDPATAQYGAARLYEFLAHYSPDRPGDPAWDYSNVGYWLLEQALVARGGMDYERLLRTRVLDPLGLKSTAVSLSPALEARLAAGHDAALRPAPLVSAVPVFAAMPGAGGLVSTANDVLTFLSAAMGHRSSPLRPDMDALLATRRPTQQPAVEQALGWQVIRDGDGELVVHDGGTFGYASSVAWDPRQRMGVVVLSNHVTGVSDIARHLLRPEVPLQKPTATKRTEIPLDAAVLDASAGRYEAEGEGVFTITRERDFLTIEAPPDWGLPKLRLRPESPRDFFTAELPLRVTFQADADGRVTGLLIHPPRGQRAVAAKRIDPDR